MLLYIFVTCESRLAGCYDRIMAMMSSLECGDFIIVKGGSSTKSSYDPLTQILSLDCNDFYEGLPEKVVKTCGFLRTDPWFAAYTHFCKLDEDMIIRTPVPVSELSDYCGVIEISYLGNRRWHMGKCSVGSAFNTAPYLGKFVPWCLGGCGYFLSKRSLDLVGGVDAIDLEKEIYEDLCVAKLLKKAGILPTHMPGLTEYIFSTDHSPSVRQQR